MCAADLFCRGDSKDTVTDGDIENFVRLAAFTEFGGHNLGGHMHQRHGLSQPRVTFAQARSKQKLYGTADARRRVPVD
jgi:hypothetical protein